MVMEFAIDHLFDADARVALRSRTAHLDFTQSAALEEFYDTVLDIGVALDAVARPETTMHAYIHSRLSAAEGIIDFYVRILSSLSLMLNTPHATQTVDTKQLLAIFVVGIQDRPLANTSLVQSMDYHPRTQYTHYEPWDLGMIAWILAGL